MLGNGMRPIVTGGYAARATRPRLTVGGLRLLTSPLQHGRRSDGDATVSRPLAATGCTAD